MHLLNKMQTIAVLSLLYLSGCGEFCAPDIKITTSPSKDQVKECRDVMYIAPQVGIKPLGYAIEQGRDIVISFKYIALTNDPAAIFDGQYVNVSKFSKDFRKDIFVDKSLGSWWDAASKASVGASFEVPRPGSAEMCHLYIAYVTNGDGTTTVYVVWHDT